MDRAQHFAGLGLATADDCDDGEEVSRVRLLWVALSLSLEAPDGFVSERDVGLY